MQRFSNYKDYIIATSVLAPAGRAFEASFLISRRVEGSAEEIVHQERLEKTFAYGGDARAAANQAAQSYVDCLPPAVAPGKAAATG
jgi:hypothetical protein